MIFLTLFLIPLLIAITTFLLGKRHVVWQEFLAQICISAVIAGVSVAIIYYTNIRDVEILGGSVVSKHSEMTLCSHSYCCMPCQKCSGSGKTRSCYTGCCMTCHRHPFDMNWIARTTIGDYLIDRVDSQGLIEPKRWTQIYTGEPVSRSHVYDNYVKASPDSLFRDQGLIESYKNVLPKYPDDIYDYYVIDRFVQHNVKLNDANAWNKEIRVLNARLGNSKQASVAVVVTTEKEQFFYALRQHWLGGKKNDVIPVIGVRIENGTAKISWVHVMSWAVNDIINIKLRDDLLELQTLDRNRVLKTIHDDVKQFYKRKSMSDFEYLQSSITPSTKQLIISGIINLLVAALAAWFMLSNDVKQRNERTSRW